MCAYATQEEPGGRSMRGSGGRGKWAAVGEGKVSVRAARISQSKSKTLVRQHFEPRRINVMQIDAYNVCTRGWNDTEHEGLMGEGHPREKQGGGWGAGCRSFLPPPDKPSLISHHPTVAAGWGSGLHAGFACTWYLDLWLPAVATGAARVHT